MIRRTIHGISLVGAMALACVVMSCDTSSGTIGLGGSGTSAATTISITGGTGQSAVHGTTLATPFSVQVLDQSGVAVVGATVTWAIAGGGGSLSATSTATGSTGAASTTYTAGPTAGTATITATVAGLTPVTFTVTVT